MSDFLATSLALGFTLLVCLLAVQALLSPWLRVRRIPQSSARQTAESLQAASGTPETAPVHS